MMSWNLSSNLSLIHYYNYIYMKINYLDTKKGGGDYVSPQTEIIELQGYPCMQSTSPNGSLQNLINNDLLDEGV